MRAEDFPPFFSLSKKGAESLRKAPKKRKSDSKIPKRY